MALRLFDPKGNVIDSPRPKDCVENRVISGLVYNSELLQIFTIPR